MSLALSVGGSSLTIGRECEGSPRRRTVANTWLLSPPSTRVKDQFRVTRRSIACVPRPQILNILNGIFAKTFPCPVLELVQHGSNSPFYSATPLPTCVAILLK